MHEAPRSTTTWPLSEPYGKFPQGGTTGYRRKSWKIHTVPQWSLPEWRGLHTPTHTFMNVRKLGRF